MGVKLGWFTDSYWVGDWATYLDFGCAPGVMDPKFNNFQQYDIVCDLQFKYNLAVQQLNAFDLLFNTILSQINIHYLAYALEAGHHSKEHHDILLHKLNIWCIYLC